MVEKQSRAISELRELQERSIADLKYDLETARQLSQAPNTHCSLYQSLPVSPGLNKIRLQ